MGSGSGLAFLAGARLEEPEVVVPPRYVISPTRGLVQFAYLVPAVRASAAASCVSPPDGSRLLCADHLCLPPPARGRCGEFDGRLPSPDGGGEGSPFVCTVQQSRSWKVFCSSTSLMVGISRLSSMASQWLVQAPVKDSGIT
jgi:hypothetical protein